MNRVGSDNKVQILLRNSVKYSILLFVLLSPLGATATPAPDVVIREVFAEILTQLEIKRESNSLTEDGAREIFASLLNPRIDYLALARWILREHWNSASGEQQTEFLRAFELYIINTYALALSKKSN